MEKGREHPDKLCYFLVGKYTVYYVLIFICDNAADIASDSGYVGVI